MISWKAVIAKKAILALLFLSTLPISAAEQWIRLTTPHFELFTTAGEKRGREAILHFEQVRNFFLQASASKSAPTLPVRIIAFKSEKQYQPYRLSEAATAYYTKTRARNYIVMENIDDQHFRTAIHEYTHLIVESLGLKLPVWMNEGWAEVYATLQPLAGKTIVGEPDPGRLQSLQNEKWLGLDTLMSVDHDSPLYNEKNKAGIFYAESWALMHMLYISRDYRTNFTKFVLAVANGQSSQAAFEPAFGRSIARAQKDLQLYAHSSAFGGIVFNIKLEKSEEDPEVSEPSAFDVDVALADILSATRRTDQAKQEYERLAKENPANADVQESLGYLAWEQNDIRAARERFGKALADGVKDPRMCYEYGTLLLQQKRDSPEAVAALERAVQLEPGYTEAGMQLALAYLNRREWGKALMTLSAIHKVKKEQAFNYFFGLAYAQTELGSRDQARANVEQAKKWAFGPEETNRVASLIQYIDARGNARKDKAQPKSLTAQASPPDETGAPRLSHVANESREVLLRRPGEQIQRVEGTAKLLECNGKRARFHVMVNGAEMIFGIDDPTSVILKHSGDSSFEFKCGPQKPFAVGVEYAPAAGANGKGIAGTLRVLEF